MLPDAKLYIDGVMRGAADGKTYDNIGPWTGDVVGKAADATAQDVNAAISAARRAFDETDWSTRHSFRHELMVKYRDLLVANRDRLVEIVRHEVGSAMGAAHSAQVAGALEGATGLIEAFPSIEWQEDRGRRRMYGFDSDRLVVRESMGVAGAITPWNVPLYVNIGKVVAGLLAGCTMVLKPAPDTPLSGSIMGELAIEAGFPKGVFNVITSSYPVTAWGMIVSVSPV